LQAPQNYESRRQITDPTLLQNNVLAWRKVERNDNLSKTLNKQFRVQDDPDEFFAFGKVFRIVWSEPSAREDIRLSEITLSTLGTGIHSKARRFIVIRAAQGYCSCLAIRTYLEQGTGKFGVNKAEHAIIHTSPTPPAPLSGELQLRAGEAPMQKEAIRIVPDRAGDHLGPESRLDFGKVYTIEHNIKVRSSGRVHEQSRAPLGRLFWAVWNTSNNSAGSPTPQRPSGTQVIPRGRPTPTTEFVGSPVYGSAIANRARPGEPGNPSPEVSSEEEDEEDDEDDDDAVTSDPE